MTIRARVEYDGQGRATSAEVEWDEPSMVGTPMSMSLMLSRMLRTPYPPVPGMDHPPAGPTDDLREPIGVLCRRFVCQHSRDAHTLDGCLVCDAPGKCPEYVGLSETVLP